MFKQQKEEKSDDGKEQDVVFTSDDNEYLHNDTIHEPDKSLIFRVWIEFLYKIFYIFHTIFQVLRLIFYPIFSILLILLDYLMAFPSYIRLLFIKNKDDKSSTQIYDCSNVIEHKYDKEFSEEFRDLVFKMLSYNMLDRPSLE